LKQASRQYPFVIAQSFSGFGVRNQTVERLCNAAVNPEALAIGPMHLSVTFPALPVIAASPKVEATALGGISLDGVSEFHLDTRGFAGHELLWRSLFVAPYLENVRELGY
jgi:hypothetical protein